MRHSKPVKRRDKNNDMEALRRALVEAEQANDIDRADWLRHRLQSVQRGDIDWYYNDTTESTPTERPDE